ncbi:protein unc-93 homolog A-like [Ptychodera flava]|uniref:protein unc-93 homolog A-like n=1 Tax=Ptychodera flava TaxID=63121 RepID=UPI003969C6C7
MSDAKHACDSDDLDLENLVVFSADDEMVDLIPREGEVRKRKVDNGLDDNSWNVSPEKLFERTTKKQKIWKDILVLSTAFMVNFSAFAGLQSLQSSINCIEGLGFASLITIYVSLIVSGLVLPGVLIRFLGVKWTIASCMSCYVVYTLANLSPQWYTFIPASMLNGLAAAPLWTSESTYIGANAYIFKEVSDSETLDAILGKFFGTFSAIYHMAGVVGNIISGTVYTKLLNRNQSHYEEPGKVYTCGASDCRINEGNVTTYCNPPPQNVTDVLIVIYAALGVTAVLLVSFLLDKLPTEKEKIRDKPVLSATVSTISLWKDYRLWMLVPIIMSGGLRMGVLTGDFNESYVTCGIGVEYVGYISLSSSIIVVITAYISGRLTQYIGRLSQFAFGMTLDFGLIMVMLLWIPDDRVALYFFLAAGWGVTDALIYVQVRSFIGALFPEHLEAAFANFYLWNAAGAAVSFSMSLIFCVSTKLYILMGVQLLALILYALLEYLYYKQKKINR